MPSRKRPLSDLQVRSLQTSASVGGAAGLECVVSAKGTKSWRLYYRIAGDPSQRRRALGLGRYPTVSLAEARERANAALKLASEGRDPRHARSERVEANDRMVDAAVERYLAWCDVSNAPGTAEDKRSLFRSRILPRLGGMPVRAVARQDVMSLLDSLGHTPSRRRAAYSYLRHFFEWAVERELVDANPCAGVRAPKAVPPRDRVLEDAEIVELWRAEGTFADMARLALLTAQRRGSIEALRWMDVDIPRRIWTVPAQSMKSGRLHEVPLSDLALDLLARLPRLGAYVFGIGSGGARPYNGSSNGMDSLRRQILGADWREQGLAAWRLHDVRRTAVTIAQRGGAMVEEIRALTQHKTPGVIGVYARHSYADEKRRVVGIIEAQLRSILAAAADQGA